MLTDAEQLLIAEAVDGPLPPRRVAELGRLVAGNAAARALLDRLHADRHGLHALARLTAPDGFADGVIVRVGPASPAGRRPASRWPAWLPYATAAGVCLAVASASFWLGAGGRQPGQIAKSPAKPSAPAPAPTRPERIPAPRLVPERPPEVARRVSPAASELAPSPRPVTPTLSAAGLFSEIAPPAEVVTRLPVLGPVAELDAAAAQAHVAAELATLTTARIDLFSPDPAAAATHLQAVAASTGLSVGLDGTARDRIKARHPGGFALYTEAATAANVAELLAKLAVRQRAGAPLLAAHLTAAGPTDLRDLKDLFGEPKRTAPARDPQVDSTIGQVVKQLNGQAAKRPAFLFALPRPPVGSKELRAFLDARGERKPDTVVLLIVVRSPEAN